ncbi:KDEL-tailed cysteine endopeptidase CEP2 [Apostasia shenzhenica]|uniref:KDEL-tailed cysteine endopeptidase CEP2 n=1 Tax=Apostasia shenzhenica TaxID=1088818 RepID=A0A2I0A467_9ASPA|nr:KDEL-tailed cysteine endopeptidase CEP2 [Apostasia shenzhenica]
MYSHFRCINLPDAIDWREKGAVTAVKNQGCSDCCWIFAAVAAVEGIVMIKKNKLIRLSEQQLLDCITVDYRDKRIVSGRIEWAFDYIMKYGITLEAKYPYTSVKGHCKIYPSVVAINRYEFVLLNNEDELMKAVLKQPVAAYVGINIDFIRYTGGRATTGSRIEIRRRWWRGLEKLRSQENDIGDLGIQVGDISVESEPSRLHFHPVILPGRSCRLHCTDTAGVAVVLENRLLNAASEALNLVGWRNVVPPQMTKKLYCQTLSQATSNGVVTALLMRIDRYTETCTESKSQGCCVRKATCAGLSHRSNAQGLLHLLRSLCRPYVQQLCMQATFDIN